MGKKAGVISILQASVSRRHVWRWLLNKKVPIQRIEKNWIDTENRKMHSWFKGAWNILSTCWSAFCYYNRMSEILSDQLKKKISVSWLMVLEGLVCGMVWMRMSLVGLGLTPARSCWWCCLGRFRRRGLIEGRVPLEVGFESWKIRATSALLSLLPACDSRCEPSASWSCRCVPCHGGRLIPWDCKPEQMLP